MARIIASLETTTRNAENHAPRVRHHVSILEGHAACEGNAYIVIHKVNPSDGEEYYREVTVCQTVKHAMETFTSILKHLTPNIDSQK